MDTRDRKERRLLTGECENRMKNRWKWTDREMGVMVMSVNSH